MRGIVGPLHLDPPVWVLPFCLGVRRGHWRLPRSSLRAHGAAAKPCSRPQDPVWRAPLPGCSWSLSSAQTSAEALLSAPGSGWSHTAGVQYWAECTCVYVCVYACVCIVSMCLCVSVSVCICVCVALVCVHVPQNPHPLPISPLAGRCCPLTPSVPGLSGFQLAFAYWPLPSSM